MLRHGTLNEMPILDPRKPNSKARARTSNMMRDPLAAAAVAILLELAREDERVLEEPEPGVVFDLFGDSSLNLAFRVFVGSIADRLPVITDMHREIHRRFAEAGIEIPFPQRDLNIDKLAPFKVEVVGGGQAPSGEVK